ncbi:methylamine dehydrogenase accessory protein MauD [Novosphingobium sp. CF614]|uniref:thioredoxin-like domain-containing protein n=1 Tax=Novosphingobium sp. CF614 TaxID=1884364 RepID=UPI0008E43161|nr:thioredoxin-like domain-containing protein [Novosphingobium sp. CF614]SFF91528.1 methylamine dehydrogenase accessory protein MauD [Novosphingobium sp. CF614]
MLVSLIIAQIVSWIVILAFGVALVALARQVGILHMRVAPAGALATSGGASVGDDTAGLMGQTLSGQTLALGGPRPGIPLRLLMFVSAQCPLCKGLIPVAKSFAKHERVELIFVGDDEPAAQHGLIAQHGLTAYPFVNDAAVGRTLGVSKLPFAVLLDEQGQILSKGLVNSREHLESLIVAHEMGVRTVQDYISGLRHAAA